MKLSPSEERQLKFLQIAIQLTFHGEQLAQILLSNQLDISQRPLTLGSTSLQVLRK
jgi:hypothetical protein